jgi:2-iminobutanoate/2-iminopropanoate deaminase
MIALRKNAPAAAVAAMLIAVAASPFVQAAPAGVPLQYNQKRNGPPGMTLPFSESVRVGEMLYLSGEIGTDASGKLVAGGIKAEARQVMDNIGADLARENTSFERVVQCTVMLADIADWPAFNAIYAPYFKQHFPARMAFATSGLAFGAHVEVQCNALAEASR